MNERESNVECAIRRIHPGDEDALLSFYNSLSVSSKRTFRPVGPTISAVQCSEIVGDNCGDAAPKYDLVAFEQGRMIGWGFLWGMNTEEPTFGLAVTDDRQGRGLGSLLMQRVMDVAWSHGRPRMELTVVQDNAPASRMYERQGFVRTGEFVGGDGLPYFRMKAECPRQD